MNGNCNVQSRGGLRRDCCWRGVSRRTPCLIGTARDVQGGGAVRAERRQERTPGPDPSSQGPNTVSCSDSSAYASAHTTLCARHSADTALEPTSTLLTTLFKTSGTVVSLCSMATGLHPEIRGSHVGLASGEHRGTVPGR